MATKSSFGDPHLGCPRCDGPCWRDEDDCSFNSTYCFDTVGGDDSGGGGGGSEFVCECRPGFVNATGSGGSNGTGTTSCADVDECEFTACGALQTCVNTPGSFSCECDAGYSSKYGGCVNVDECVVAPSPCGPGGSCTDAVGSFTCTCLSGNYVYGSSDLCRPCERGHYLAGGSACVRCPDGTYSNTTNSASCAVCDGTNGVLVANAAATGCDCPPSYSLSADGSKCDIICPPGYRSVGGVVCQVSRCLSCMEL